MSSQVWGRALDGAVENALPARSRGHLEVRHDGHRGHAQIVLVEDHAILRAGLRALLELENDLDIVGEAASAADGVRLVMSCRPQLVIVDVSLPDGSGLDAIPLLRKACPESRVLVLTAHCTDEYIRTALRFGADGYVLKDAQRAELLLAVRTVLTGSRYLSPLVSAKVVSGYLQRREAQQSVELSGVTDRERQILVMVARGVLTRHIAAELGVSIKTVEKHRSSLMRKLSLRNPAAVTMFAIRHGLLPAGELPADAGPPAGRES
jgi:DNA-binding NarL/FixJ family response regulator